jgi:hypothetical protein
MSLFDGDWEVNVGGTNLRITIQDAGNDLISILLMNTSTVIGQGSTHSIGGTPISISFFRREDTGASTVVHFYTGVVEMINPPSPSVPPTRRPTRVRGRHRQISASSSGPLPLDDEWTGTRPPA